MTRLRRPRSGYRIGLRERFSNGFSALLQWAYRTEQVYGLLPLGVLVVGGAVAFNFITFRNPSASDVVERLSPEQRLVYDYMNASGDRNQARTFLCQGQIPALDPQAYRRFSWTFDDLDEVRGYQAVIRLIIGPLREFGTFSRQVRVRAQFVDPNGVKSLQIWTIKLAEDQSVNVDAYRRLNTNQIQRRFCIRDTVLVKTLPVR